MEMETEKHFTHIKSIRKYLKSDKSLRTFAKEIANGEFGETSLTEEAKADATRVAKNWFSNKKRLKKTREPSEGHAGRNWKKFGLNRKSKNEGNKKKQK